MTTTTTSTSLSHEDVISRATGEWTLDPSGSSVHLRHATLWGLIKVKGHFTGLRGHGQVEADGSIRGDISVDAASVDTNNKKRDHHLRSDHFFKVDTHPEITFEARSARRDGAGFVVDGDLTAAGQSRELQVPVVLRDWSQDAITLEADVEVDRTRHGMTFNQLGMLRGLTKVHVVARFVRPATDTADTADAG